MEVRILQYLASKTLPATIPIHTNPLTSATKTTRTQIFLPRRGRYPRLNSTDSTDNNSVTPPPVQPTITPPDTVEIKFKRGSRKRNKNRRKDGASGGLPAQAKVPDPPKKWEDMSLNEKALELYVGEKGALFWLNKFAYASIFIVIGGWILFRFVGPALNLYQLDTPPLSPSSILKG